MQIKKIEKFINEQIKLLIKNPKKIFLGILLLILLIVFIPIVEGLESDSFWCKYFSWFPGVTCEDKPKEEEDDFEDKPKEEEDDFEDDFFKDDEESTQEESEPSADPTDPDDPDADDPDPDADDPDPDPDADDPDADDPDADDPDADDPDADDPDADDPDADDPDAESTPSPEPELPLCTCNANCQLRNKSEDRVLDENCRIPEGVENITNVNGYCDKCFDIVNTGCRSNIPDNDPVLMADDWCKELGGSKITGANVLERCKPRSLFFGWTPQENVLSGAWTGMTFEEAYPKVLVNHMVNSDKFSGAGGKCENNMNPKLKWTEYAHPN